MRKVVPIISSFLIFLSVLISNFCTQEQSLEENEGASEFIFLNHSEKAQYTGTESCIKCHKEIHEDYVHTGKGRAFHEVDINNQIENFENVHVYDKYSGYHYTAFWRADKLFIKEYRMDEGDTVFSQSIQVQYVIGSGNQTRSYLFEENGYFFEFPITWYVKKGIWDLSPGYENGANTRFSRPISQMCMNCHNSDFQFAEHSVNRFLKVGSGIGCEKCHGPGGLHIDKHEQGEFTDSIDYSIVNPAHLSLELQFDVCRQCHLEGVAVEKTGKQFFDYKPGMPLNEFWEVFIPVGENANDFGFASHVERLQMSQCFINSSGKMNCTTCHDPHKPLSSNPISFYNNKCQSCHGEDACGAEHQTLALAEDNCIKCHMPKDGTTDIPHVSTSDHFIRVVNDSVIDRGAENGIKNFRIFTNEESSSRDIFLANMDYYEKVDQNREYLNRIEKYLGDVELRFKVKYFYLRKMSPPNDILEISPEQINEPYTAFYIGEMRNEKGLSGQLYLEKAVELAPENLEFRTRLGNQYMRDKKYALAKSQYQSVLKANNREIQALVNMGFIMQLEGDLPRALDLTENALGLDPLYLKARENKINILLNMGDIDLAKRLLENLISDYPDNGDYKSLMDRIIAYQTTG